MNRDSKRGRRMETKVVEKEMINRERKKKKGIKKEVQMEK